MEKDNKQWHCSCVKCKEIKELEHMFLVKQSREKGLDPKSGYFRKIIPNAWKKRDPKDDTTNI
jgi:hypothetical protein